MSRARPARAVPVAFAAWVVLTATVALGEPREEGSPTGLELTSPSFNAMGEMPRRHTCEGADVSPELRWKGVPEGTKSVVLIVDDPDAPDPAAPRMTWVHWVLYDIPPDATGLPEAVPMTKLPPGTKQGRNDWQRTGCGGPYPPLGRHRYFHKLYALGEKLGDLGEPTKAELERAMQGKVLAQAELVGIYEKSRELLPDVRKTQLTRPCPLGHYVM